MYNTSFIKKILLVATVVLLYSCDKDFNAIGEELIGDNHFDLVPEEYDVLAYNQEVTPVQSNGLPAYSIGIYNNPGFGETTSNFVSQLSLADYSGTIGESPVIESAVLTVPYFSHITAADPKGGSVYALDSIYGAKPEVGKLKLSVYESGVQMYDSYFEGGSQFAQLYYSDQDSYFSDNKKLNDGKPLNDSSDKTQNENFYFSAAQIKDSTAVITAKDTTYTYVYTKPQMRLELNKDFFQKKILEADVSKLTSSVAFQQYFRGLYFKVEKSGSSPTNMALLDMAAAGDAKITITYKAKTASTTDAATATETKTLVINLTANTANLLQDAKDPAYQAALTNRNTAAGDDRLYLKGGQGSVAVVELKGFGEKLEEIKKTNWLVNEANLVFYIDADKMKTAEREPKRVYLYDLDNNTILADYVDATSSSTTDTKATRTVFGGILNVDATTKKGVSYKIRITKHIRNLIKDETGTLKNVRLGLAVTEGIDVITTNKLKLKNDLISDVPTGSVMGPLGTVLYGGTANAGDKKVKLEIYYTKPN